MKMTDHVCDVCGKEFARTVTVPGFRDPGTCSPCWQRANRGQRHRAPREVPAMEVEMEMVIEEDDTPTETDQVKALTEDVQGALVVARDFTITSQDDLEGVEAMLEEVKGKAKALEALKKSITGPMNEALNAARALFRPAESALASIEAEFKGKVKQWERDQTQRALEAQKALQQATTSAQAKTALAARAAAEVKHSKGVVTSKVWKFEVTDHSEVPREYLIVDTRLIQDAVRQGVREIPGVRIYEDVQVSVRTGK